LPRPQPDAAHARARLGILDPPIGEGGSRVRPPRTAPRAREGAARQGTRTVALARGCARRGPQGEARAALIILARDRRAGPAPAPVAEAAFRRLQSCGIGTGPRDCAFPGNRVRDPLNPLAQPLRPPPGGSSTNGRISRPKEEPTMTGVVDQVAGIG